VEATGNYSLELCFALHDCERIEVMVVNPRSSSDFAKALMQRSKTDATDAVALLEYVRRMPFVAWQPPPHEILQLRAITRRIAALVETRTQELNRLHAAGYSKDLSDVIADDIRDHIDHLEQSVETLTDRAEELVQSDCTLLEKYEHLTSVKGIARTSGLAILAELAALPPDMSARQWVAHSGLDPRHFESGTSVHKPARISKKGNRYLRAALYMPALVAIRCEPSIKTFYQRLVKRGKKPMQAIVAVMRKLLHAIHGMLRSHTNFDGAKFHGHAA
jgi:transposase